MTAATRAAGRPLGAALVGAGVIGGTHALAIKDTDGIELRHIVDNSAETAKLAAEFVGEGVTYGTELSEALARDDIDLVALATPSGVHAEDGLRILAAGRHLLVEKPVDTEPVRARQLGVAAAAAAGRGIRSSVVSQHRFDPASRLVAGLVAGGRFGALTSGIASVPWWRSQGYYDSAGWRGTWAMDGGGALANQGIHTLDLLLWMFGEPVTITAHIGLLAHERMEVEDTLVATLTFASGALAVLHATTAASPGLGARLQVMGTAGSAVIERDRLSYLHVVEPGEDIGAFGLGGEGNQAEAALLEAEGPAVDATVGHAAHAKQYADLVAAIADGRDPAISIADGVLALEVVRGCYVSATLGRTVTLEELTRGDHDGVTPRLPGGAG